MDQDDFDNIMEGLEEALAIEKGEVKPDPSRVHVFHVPDAKAIRANTGLSQSQFANRFGIAVQTLQAWEAGRRNPVGPAATLLKVISNAPETVAKVVEADLKEG